MLREYDDIKEEMKKKKKKKKHTILINFIKLLFFITKNTKG